MPWCGSAPGGLPDPSAAWTLHREQDPPPTFLCFWLGPSLGPGSPPPPPRELLWGLSSGVRRALRIP